MKPKVLISILIIFSLILAVTGCNPFGSASGLASQRTFEAKNLQPFYQEEPVLAKIIDILQTPEVYSGRAVIIEGRIMNQCISGCWFTLNDGTGIIYVDLAPNDFSIPQNRGANVKVLGEVIRKGADTYLLGARIEF